MENQTLNTNNQTNVSNELTQNLPSTKVIQTDVVATPQQRVSLPSTQPTQVTQPVQPTSVIDGALNQIKLNESEQQAVNAEQNITARMLEDIAGLEGQSAFQNQLIEQSNIKQLRTDLQGLNSRILQKEAEIAQDDVKLIGQLRAEERRDTLLPFAQSAQARIQGDAQIVRALKMAEIGVLNAQAIGKQGDIQLARQFVDDAVNARYAPYKERIETGRMQLEALKPFLSRAEQKQAKTLDIKVNQAIKEIDRVSAFQTKLLNNAIEAQASPSVIDAIMRGSSIQEIAKAGRGYEMSRAEKLENNLKQAQLNKINSEISKNSGVSDSNLPLMLQQSENKISKIQALKENTKGIRASAGVIKRRAGFSGDIRTFRADIKTILAGLTLDEISRAKGNGVTFGSLTNDERQAVAAAASVLSSAQVLDKQGRPTGYFDIPEDKVRDELQKIQDLAEIDFQRRTGVSYNDYIISKNQTPSVEEYENNLLTSGASSPFSSFGISNIKPTQ